MAELHSRTSPLKTSMVALLVIFHPEYSWESHSSYKFFNYSVYKTICLFETSNILQLLHSFIKTKQLRSTNEQSPMLAAACKQPHGRCILTLTHMQSYINMHMHTHVSLIAEKELSKLFVAI